MSLPNRMQTHWPAVKTFIKKEWPLLTETTVDKIAGDFDRFLKCLDETYDRFPLEEAITREKIQKFINSLEGL